MKNYIVHFVQVMFVLTAIYITDARAAGNFEFENKCNHPVKLAVAFKGLNNNWYEEGWWYINPGVKTFLSVGNTRIRSNNNTWYFYAETTDGSKKTWKGNQNIPFRGQTLQMIKHTKTGTGNFYWNIKCSQGPPKYQGKVSNQNGANIGGGGANGYATFYRDGTLQITGEAWSNEKHKGTKASVFVILVDGWGRALFVSPMYSIPTACGQWDPTCQSSTSRAWTFQAPKKVAPYIKSLDVFVSGRNSDYWRSRVSAINSAVRAYDDLDPQIKQAITAAIAAL